MRSLEAPIRSGMSGSYVTWLLGLLALVSCSSGPSVEPEVNDGQTFSPQPLPAAVSLSPRAAGRGQQLTAQVYGISTQFDESTRFDLGAGIQLFPTILSPTEASLELVVEPDATPGYRTLTVTQGEEVLTRDQALLVQQGALSISPASADRGQTVLVHVTVQGETLVPGYSFVDFGPGTFTSSFTVLDDHQATVQVRVASDAAPGLRDVTMQTGEQRVLLPDGFLVDRGLIAITFEPTVVSQGEVVPFVLTGYGTHFVQGLTSLDLGLGLLTDPLDPLTFVVESPTRITGTLEVCESAVVGSHDVKVITALPESPPEVVQALEGVRVDEVPIGAERAYASVSLVLSRLIREGQVIASVGAYASFNAVVAACGTYNGTSCAVSTTPFDQPAFYPPPGCTPVPNTTDYPPTPSFDAGEHVWLSVADGPVITLERQEDLSGSIYYASRLDVPVEDFWFDAAYDLEVEGADGSYAIPAFTVPGAVVTPPSDFVLVEPDLDYAPTLDRYDALPARWTDLEGQPGAHTFPVGAMYSRIRTVDPDGNASEIRVIPFDDGEYVFPASLISQLYPGAGRFLLQTTRPGASFTIPGSAYTSYAGSGVYYEGYFELRD